jgi:hypothetical protein
MWRSVRFIAALVATLLLPAIPAQACSYGVERSALEALRAATAVFDGTIVDLRAVLTEVHGSTTAAIVYEVAVRRVHCAASPETGNAPSCRCARHSSVCRRLVWPPAATERMVLCLSELVGLAPALAMRGVGKSPACST